MKKEFCGTDKQKLQAQKVSIKEGSAYSIMDGFGLRYITPYALTLGATNTHIGILNTLPNLLGSFSELFSLKAINHQTRKKFVHKHVLLQSLMWLFVIAIGIMFFIFNIDHTAAPITLIVVYSVLIMLGMYTVPAWMSWMKDIVPERCGSYFGLRNKISGFVALACMLVAGFILDYFKKTSVFVGFAVLFFIAFLGRYTSARLFLKQYEPKFTPERDHKHGFVHFVERISESNFGKFTLFVSLMSMMVAIASPFFAVYMLNTLNFNYVTFTVVTLSEVLTMFLFMTAWGKFADVYGNMKTMRITGFLIPFVPLLWLFSPLFQTNMPNLLVPYLILISLFSGTVWAGFNLSTSDFIYDSANPKNIGSFTAYLSILNNFGFFVGGVVGGFISSKTFTFIGLPAILVIFLISGVMRFVIAGTFLPHLREVKKVKSLTFKQAEHKIAHISLRQIVKSLR
jgi:MFS family permease